MLGTWNLKRPSKVATSEVAEAAWTQKYGQALTNWVPGSKQGSNGFLSSILFWPPSLFKVCWNDLVFLLMSVSESFPVFTTSFHTLHASPLTVILVSLETASRWYTSKQICKLFWWNPYLFPLSAGALFQSFRGHLISGASMCTIIQFLTVRGYFMTFLRRGFRSSSDLCLYLNCLNLFVFLVWISWILEPWMRKYPWLRLKIFDGPDFAVSFVHVWPYVESLRVFLLWFWAPKNLLCSVISFGMSAGDIIIAMGPGPTGVLF